jgi:hypothetical protein
LRARAVNVGDDPSIDQACDKFGLGKRYVQKIFKDGRNSEPALLERTDRLISALQSLVKDMGPLNEPLLKKLLD